MTETKHHGAGTGGRGDLPEGQLLRAVLSQPVRRSALRQLLACDSSNVDELARDLCVGGRHVRYHLGILRTHDLVTRTGDPRRQSVVSCFAATCKEEGDVLRHLAETEVEDRKAFRDRQLPSESR